MTQDATFKELDMAVHVSLHRAPGLSQEEIDGFAPEVAKGVHATFLQLFVNTDTGFIVTVYEAESAEAVEQEFERIGFPFEAIHGERGRIIVRWRSVNRLFALKCGQNRINIGGLGQVIIGT